MATITVRTALSLKQVLGGVKCDCLGPNVLAFSPDSKYVIAGGTEESSHRARMNDGTIAWTCGLPVYDCETGNLAYRLPIGERDYYDATRLHFSSGGKYLACVTRQGLYVWDFASCELMLKVYHYQEFGGGMYPLFVDRGAGEELLVADGQSSVRVFGVDPWFESAVYRYSGRGGCGPSVISPQGNRVAVLSTIEGLWGGGIFPLKVWNVQNGEAEWSCEVDLYGRLDVVAFHPSGKAVAVGQRDMISVFSAENGELISELRLPRGTVTANVSFNAAGDVLAAGLVGEWECCALFDWEWGTVLQQLPLMNQAHAFSRDGSLLAAAGLEMGIWTAYDSARRDRDIFDEPPDYDSQGRPYGDPYYGDE